MVVAAAVYGFFGMIFTEWYSPRIQPKSFPKFEKLLLFSSVPFLFFGLVVLPLSGVSFFGISSNFASPSNVYFFPISLFVGTTIFAVSLDSLLASNVKTSGKQQARVQVESRSASRRTFIEKGVLTLAAMALLFTGVDRMLGSQSGTSAAGTEKGAAINTVNEPQIFQDARLASLVNSEVTDNSDFYQVDIDTFFLPSVDPSTWSLQVTGLVQNPKTYSLSDLQALPKTVEYNTFECVSNDVNGGLISNAKWGGVRLADIFSDMGGVSQGAAYVVLYSVDGYSAGVPIAKTLMHDSMLAYDMNDVSLPQRHGYPLRAVFPGLYGMMSPKWIRKISVINTSYMGYWQTRGWSDVGIVQTLAFISVPADGSSQSLSTNNGNIIVGGFAYAGDRGISNVEVSVDGGKTWQVAALKPPISNDTWALWAFEWTPAQTGLVNVYARATDGTGTLQTSTQTGNFPNGATGYASISINVTN